MKQTRLAGDPKWVSFAKIQNVCRRKNYKDVIALNVNTQAHREQ